jgi:hypothetical protein
MSKEPNNGLRFFLLPLAVLASPPLNESVEDRDSLEPAGSA